MRAAISACRVSGIRTAAPSPCSTSILTVSSTNSGFPSVFSRRTVRSPSGSAAPSTSASTSSAVSESGSGPSSIVIERRRPPPQPGPRVEELGAREADDEHRCVVDAVGEVLDEVEERLLRPVDVLEAEHDGLRLREARRPLVRSPGDLLAAAGPETLSSTPDARPSRSATASLVHASRSFSIASSGESSSEIPAAACTISASGRYAMPSPNGMQRPGQDARPLEAGEELLREPALADPRVAEDRHELRPPVADDAGEDVVQQLELLLAADVRRRDVERPPDGPVGADDAPDRDLAVEPLEGAVADRLDGDPAGGEAVCRRPDQDLAGLRALLEPRGDVERLAGRERRVARLRDDLPASIPMRTGRSPSPVSRIATAARTARSASSSCAIGTPKTATTASPANFSTVPPYAAMCAAARSKNAVTRRRTTSGSLPATSAVESTRSTNSAVASLRSMIEV